MKKIVLAAVAALVVASAAQATSFTFKETLHLGYDAANGNAPVTGTKVKGSFDGDVSGNIISNLSNISVFLNGAAFVGNGALYASSVDPSSGFVSGGGVVSLDGTANNFLFIDTDYPNDNNYHNFFYNISGLAAAEAAVDVVNGNAGGIVAYDSPALPGSLKVTQASAAAVPEPATWAMFIGGFGLVGAGMRRRKVNVSFA